MHPLVWRGLIWVVDSMFGAALWPVVARMFVLKAFSGVKTSDWDEKQIPNLDGKVAVVTGAKYELSTQAFWTQPLSNIGINVSSAGIGYHTVKQLALKGAKVYLGARSESRAKAAIERLLGENPSIPRENISWLRLDLSSLAQVVDAALELRSKEGRLDILSTFSALTNM